MERGRENSEKIYNTLREEARAIGIEIKTKVALGHQAEQIIHLASQNHVDVIVMGYQSKNTLSKWLLDSIPARVVDHAPCTVIVVKGAP